MNKYKLKITGKNKDYFIKILINKGINIFDLIIYKDYFIVVVDYNGYKTIKNIKTSYKIEVVRVYGVLYLSYLFRKYFTFILFFIIGIIISIIISRMIFSIDVNSNNKHIVKVIEEDLRDRGIYKYQFRKSFTENNKIIKSILDEEKDTIEWLSIRNNGTHISVDVVERKLNNKENVCIPSNIVSKKDAIISRISASSGEVIAYINKSVKKGDILISGSIHNKDIVVNNKCSRGSVFGEVWYSTTLVIPKHYVEENVTGNSSFGIGISFLKFNSKSKFKTYKVKNISILNNRLFNIGINFVKYMETDVIDKYFTIDNIDSYAIKLGEEKLNDKLSTDSRIISKKILKKEEKSSKIIVEVFYKVEENIGIEEPINIGE